MSCKYTGVGYYFNSVIFRKVKEDRNRSGSQCHPLITLILTGVNHMPVSFPTLWTSVSQFPLFDI